MISGPSGAGKTSIVSGLLARRPELVKSVSVTTRAPRSGERDGVDYRFVTAREFERMRAAGEFLESALVHGNHYGTPRAPVQSAAGKTVVLEIDVQGARSVRTADPAALLIFIEPPSWAMLEERLVGRRTDPAEVIERRLVNAREELAAAPEFDYRVVNEDLGGAIDEVLRILDAAAPPRGAGPTL